VFDDKPIANRHGLLIFDMERRASQHPITVLIDQATEKAQKMEQMIRERTTLQDAIDDYRKMTGGVWDPPRGFDKWWVERWNLSVSPTLPTYPFVIG
jgi:hypothetical protein